VRLLNTPPHDTVTELLATLKVRSSVYCLSELSAPWGFEVEGENIAKFHIVLAGGCWLRAGGQEPVWLESGEVVLLPHGDRHVLSDPLESPVQGLDRIVAGHPLDANGQLCYGGSGARTRLLCGGFALAEAMPARLLALLPAVLQINGSSAGVTTWLEPVFALLRQEADSAAPGAQAIFAKLADVFLSQALRTYLVGAEQAGLVTLEPLLDRQIEHAVAQMHAEPARRWTLQALAREAGMSRTAFAARFRAVVGESPMRHLARVRLGQAAGYLTTTSLSIYAISRRSGYDSDASLSKAFKREFGAPPGEYRRNGGKVAIRPVR
jgi:AraC-like DNA-binding protein